MKTKYELNKDQYEELKKVYLNYLTKTNRMAFYIEMNILLDKPNKEVLTEIMMYELIQFYSLDYLQEQTGINLLAIKNEMAKQYDKNDVCKMVILLKQTFGEIDIIYNPYKETEENHSYVIEKVDGLNDFSIYYYPKGSLENIDGESDIYILESYDCDNRKLQKFTDYTLLNKEISQLRQNALRNYENSNTCVVCGAVIPEGVMVCPLCEKGNN